MSTKAKIVIYSLLAVAALVLLVIFWRDLGLMISRIGTALFFAVITFVIAWILGFMSGRKHSKKA